METKHTPGPWFARLNNSRDTLFSVTELKTGKRIATVKTKANSQLIASAPDLLQELELAHKIINNSVPFMAQDRICIARIQERELVLKKAKGEAT